MTSRRSFLLGIGALVSASFVTRAKAHVLETARPLLLEPKKGEETLYLYDQSGWDDEWKWRVSLGPDIEQPPSPPTWREYLMLRGYKLDSELEVPVSGASKGSSLIRSISTAGSTAMDGRASGSISTAPRPGLRFSSRS